MMTDTYEVSRQDADEPSSNCCDRMLRKVKDGRCIVDLSSISVSGHLGLLLQGLWKIVHGGGRVCWGKAAHFMVPG